MSIEVRRSNPTDRDSILRLMELARGSGLSPEQRAERGFVQGVMNENALEQLEAGTGIYVAVEDRRLAGFAMTSTPDAVHDGPPQLAVDAARAAVGDKRLFMYGPVAVDPQFQGRGVLTSLLRFLSACLRGEFELGVVFVETANQRSLDVHRHYGMAEIPGFTFQSRDYHVFTFDPVDLSGQQS